MMIPIGMWANQGFTGTFNAGSGTDSCDGADIAGSTWQIIWYQIGDASGREGEVWCEEDGLGFNKVNDWVTPNDDSSSDLYIRFSNLVGDTPAGWSTAWQKLGGSGSGNVSLDDGVANPGNVFATWDVELGTDGSTADAGPTEWAGSADAS